jgi:hypothetical protein
MKKTWIFAVILVTGMLLFCGLNAFAQQQEPTPQPATAPDSKVEFFYGQSEKTPSPSANTFNFVNSEFVFDGKPIKGAPYSAEAVTETTQVLSDGNRIVNRSTATLYRDTEGRTRREQTLKAIGGISAGAVPLQMIMINDPVAGVSYTLDPGSRTANKNPMGSFTFQRAVAGPSGNANSTTNVVFGAAGSDNQTHVGLGTGVGTGTGVTIATTAPSNAPTTLAPLVNLTAQSISGGGYQVVPSAVRGGEVKKEDLGTQTIEGVAANGTRTTFTIPAGQIGNEGPIDIVDERWFSKDLQVTVMTRHSDPRSGETLYRLTNINRTEPDHSLFEVPSDYQVKEPTMLPMRTRKPENN